MFFKNYLTEAQATGQIPTPSVQPAAQQAPKPPAIPIGTLVAPGTARPATGQGQVPPDKPVFTLGQIREFYSNAGRARYVGREQDRQNDEQEIFAAQREGRVRG